MRTILELFFGILIFMLAATLGMMVTCMVLASKERRTKMAKDLIDRQALLAQLEAQEQAYRTEMAESNVSDLVKPSWTLAMAMIRDMPKKEAE